MSRSAPFDRSQHLPRSLDDQRELSGGYLVLPAQQIDNGEFPLVLNASRRDPHHIAQRPLEIIRTSQPEQHSRPSAQDVHVGREPANGLVGFMQRIELAPRPCQVIDQIGNGRYRLRVELDAVSAIARQAYSSKS
jgi:hypothetical protein